jgi:hypothetical protein
MIIKLYCSVKIKNLLIFCDTNVVNAKIITATTAVTTRLFAFGNIAENVSVHVKIINDNLKTIPNVQFAVSSASSLLNTPISPIDDIENEGNI